MDSFADSRWRRLLRSVLYAFGVSLPLGMLAFLVHAKFDPLVRFDQNVISAATDYTRGHPGFRSFVNLWETISQPFVIYLALGVPVSLYVWFVRKHRTRAWWGLATMAVGWGIAVLLKSLVRRSRPVISDPIGTHNGYSFPSGHATNNAIAITVILVLLWPLVGDGVRRLLVGLGATWVLVTCADRIFAGAHFPSDVIAGVVLGCGLTWASYAGYQGWSPTDPKTETTKGSD